MLLLINDALQIDTKWYGKLLIKVTSNSCKNRADDRAVQGAEEYTHP